jgi:hypothetical protein
MKYYVVSEGQIEILMDKIKTIILRELKPLNLPQVNLSLAKAHQKAIRQRGSRPRLADLIFSTMKEEAFSPADVYEKIKDQYPFKGNRGIDAIRTAMKADTLRFRPLENGSFTKIKPENAE